MLTFLAIICFACCIACVLWAAINGSLGGIGGNDEARASERTVIRSLALAVVLGLVGLLFLLQ